MSLSVSFEFFPPKTPEMEATLWRSIARLAPLNPLFVSVTYGAGGSTRERTHATIKRILAETHLTPAAHLTCVGASRAMVDEVVRDYWESGIRHIVALRGDMPEAGAAYAPHNDGYASTPDLIRGILKIAPFEVSVSAYPEKHPESPSLEADYALLKAKIDAGANRAITHSEVVLVHQGLPVVTPESAWPVNGRWLLQDAWSSVKALATPAFAMALAGSALCYWALVWRRAHIR